MAGPDDIYRGIAPPPASPWGWVPDEWQFPPAPAAAEPLAAVPPAAASPVAPEPVVSPAPAFAGAPTAASAPLPWGIPGAPESPLASPEPPMQLRAPLPWEAVDAVSGGDIPEQAPTPERGDEGLLVPDLDGGPVRSAGETGARAAAIGLAQMSPEEYALQRAEFEEGARREEAAKYLDASTRNLEEAEQNKRDLVARTTATRKQMDALNADVQKLSGKEIDTGRWWKSRSTGQKVAGYIAAALGGMLQVARGTPNSALDLIQKSIENDIAAQQSDLARQGQALQQRQGILAQQMAEHGDLYRASEAARLASLQNVENQIKAEMANYDPQGSQAFRAAELLRGVAAAKQETYAKAEQTMWDRSVVMVEQQRKDDEFALKLEEREDKLRKERAAAAGAGARRAKAERDKWVNRYYEGAEKGFIDTAQFPTADAWLNAGAPAAGASGGKAIELATKQADLTKKEKEAAGAMSDEERELRQRGLPDPQRPGEYLRGPNGEPMLVVGSPEKGAETRNAISSGKGFIQNIDKLLAIGERSNWSPKLINAKDRQEADAIVKDTVQYYRMLIKLGQMTKEEQKFAEEVVRDPTAFMDYAPTLKQHRLQAIDRVNAEGRANVLGWTDVSIPEPGPIEGVLSGRTETVSKIRHRGDKLKAPTQRFATRAAEVGTYSKQVQHTLRQLKDEDPATRIAAYDRELAAVDALLAEEKRAARAAGEVDSSGRPLGNDVTFELSNLRSKLVQDRSKLQDSGPPEFIQEYERRQTKRRFRWGDD